MPESQRTVKTSNTVFEILETLKEEDGASTLEVAEACGIATSTAHDHLVTLREMEYVIKSGETYKIGLKFLSLGMAAKHDMQLTKVARPVLEALADDTGEMIRLFVKEYDDVVVVDMAEGDRAVVTGIEVGMRLPMTYTGGGKAILAYLPEAEVLDLIERRGIPNRTENTITQKEALLQEFEEIRERGVAFNDEEALVGLRGVASPIVTNNTVHGAVSVGAPTNRMGEKRFRETIPDLVKGASNEIELKLSFQ